MGILYLALTDKSTSTVVLSDGGRGASPLRLAQEGWAPVVAGLRPPMSLGGLGPYADVEETIPIMAATTGAPDVYAALRQLEALLRQAALWRRYPHQYAPVYVQIVPAGSARSISNPLEALVVGYPGDTEGGAGPIELASAWSRAPLAGLLDDIRISLIRRGAWLGETDVASDSASAGTAFTATFATSHDEYSPITFGWDLPNTPSSSGQLYAISGSGLVATDDADRLLVYDDASFASPSAPWSTSVQSNALGGNVRRYTPAAANTFSGTSLNVPSIFAVNGTYLVYASLRASSAAPEWSLYVSVALRSTRTIQTEPITWKRGDYNTAELVALGIISLPTGDPQIGTPIAAATNAVQLFAAASTISGSPVLDVDYLVIVRVDPSAFAQRYDLVYGSAAAAYWGTSQQLAMEVLAGTPDRRNPVGYVFKPVSLGGMQPVGITGSPELWARGDTIAGVWVAGTSDQYAAGLYRARDGSGLWAPTFSFTRRRAYLIPT